MCELLGLNANTPTDLGFSFRGLSRRGGGTSEHADGWGLASFTPDGRGLLAVAPHRASRLWEVATGEPHPLDASPDLALVTS